MSRTTAQRRSWLGQSVREIHSLWPGLAGQGLRFALSGVLVAVVYGGVTLLLSDGLLVPFQIALGTGFIAGLALHFTLQRLFVWRHDGRFALPAGPQALRYVAMCLTQYAITALSTSRLPRLLGLPVEVVYLVTAISVGAINFGVFRNRIFHPAPL